MPQYPSFTANLLVSLVVVTLILIIFAAVRILTLSTLGDAASLAFAWWITVIVLAAIVTWIEMKEL